MISLSKAGAKRNLCLLIHCLIVPLRKQTTIHDVDLPPTVEETLAGMRRNLQTFYQCNGALIRATEEYELLQSVCRILVEVGGFRMVWIGYRQFDQEKTIRPVGQVTRKMKAASLADLVRMAEKLRSETAS